jgi:pimeloyl-ACP methyl ester carboxylesterase
MLRRANELFDSPVRWDDVWAEDKKRAKQVGSQKWIPNHTRIKEIARIADSQNPHAELTEEQRKRILDDLDALLAADPKAQKRKVDYYARSRPGAVEQFLSRLDEECRNGKRYSITLVGHSMGAIVGNEMLKRHPDLPFDKIIYMAAACSVKDCQDSVVPYLRLRKREKNPAQFYNLSLHPIAEAAEASFSPDSPTPILSAVGKTVVGLVLVPRGSLLEWLDGFFTKPVNYEDRRLGEWGTAITSAGIFPSDVADCVHLKMFPVGIKSKDVPQKHGQFGDDKGEVHFWRPEFCDPNATYRNEELRTPTELVRGER